MKWQLIFLLLMGMKWWRFVYSTCVFESDFGFTFNCAFKKSSIFRIRNLGGVKGYFGLGFSVGDELGFRESLSNVESTNRRSVESGRSASGYFQQLLTTTQRTERQVSPENSPPPTNGSRLGNERSNHAINIRAPGSKYASVSLNPVTVPPFKPIYPASGNQLSRPVRLSKDDENRHSLPPTLIAVPAFASLPDSIAKLSSSSASSASPAYNKRVTQQAFQNMLQNANRRFALTSGNGAVANDIELSNSINQQPKMPSTNRYHVTPDPFFPDTVSHALKNVAQMHNISADALLASIQLRQQQLLLQQQKQHLAALTTTTVFEPPTTTTTVSTTTATTTTTTTPPPTTSATTAVGNDQISKLNSLATSIKQKYSVTSTHKVMNAPKEYYPVSYEKNFDDNFTAKVELPDTSFSCGDQKHFPGLYADEDLNCMVFHVCAFTDEGLVMKSFLCPESTLFDQTILKCNWWFYVDCKSSKKLYDSNIPISKSYQLMKALAFFSSYSKKEQNVVT